jgi:phage major head subunit gpT-like protein
MGQPVFAPQMLRKDVRGEFIEAEMVERAPFLYERIATITQSQSDRENYAFLSNPASMDEFVDTMPIHPLTDTGLTPQTGNNAPGYEIVNKTFAGALIFKRDDMADAKVGGYRQRIQDQAAAAHGYPDERLITRLVAGTSETCYIQVGAAGEAFFTATHAARGKQTTTWSNLLTGTGTRVAQIATDLGSAIAALYNMTNEANRPMNRYFKQLFCLYHPTHDVNMRTAVLAQTISSTSNVGLRPAIELIPEPLLSVIDASNPNDYYVGILDAPIRGMIWQEREGVALEEIGEGSEMWTNLRQVEYAVTRRGEAGFGFPQRLVKINNS